MLTEYNLYSYIKYISWNQMYSAFKSKSKTPNIKINKYRDKGWMENTSCIH